MKRTKPSTASHATSTGARQSTTGPDGPAAEPGRNSAKNSGHPRPPPIGGKLHVIRKSRNLTLSQVEELSGVSKSMLSQIERGKVNPTFATLWHLTQSLGIDIGELLEKARSAAGRMRAIEHLKIYSTPTITSSDGKVNVKILSPRRFMLPIEWYEMILAPGGALRANAHGNGAWEHMTVVSGRLVVEIGDDEVVLEEGETVRYSAEQPHGCRNDSKRQAKALLVLVPLDELEARGHAHYQIEE